MNQNELSRIQELYEQRFQQFGRDVRTVGWGSIDDQILRFEVLFRELDPRGKTILDVGCGLADLIPFLEARTGGDFAYVGIDVTPSLIADASARYRGERFRFAVGSVLTVPDLHNIDISVLSGALSFRTQNNESYARENIRKMLAISREAACLNFLSRYCDFQLEKNYHYQPEELFAYSKTLTRFVNLHHDYRLYEFTLQLRHQPLKMPARKEER